MTNRHFFIVATPLLLILFIDGMGLGLVFPILNNLIINPVSQFLPASTPESFRNLIFGIIIGIFMLCWFFGAPLLGDLSDQIGRKKSLMICLLGAALGYFISGLGVSAGSVVLLTLGRVIAGFTSGSQSIAQASIVDMSTAEHKARNIGFILLAVSLGFIFGPIVGGVLSDKQLVSYFSFSLPFYFAALISLINALLLQWLFQETFQKTDAIKLQWSRAIDIFMSAFVHKNIRHLSIIFLIMIFGWSSYYSFISMFLLKKYAFTNLQTTFFMALLGVGFGIGNGFLGNYLAKFYRLKPVIIVSCVLTSLAVLVTVTTQDVIFAWLMVIPLAAFISVAYAFFITVFSNQVAAQLQGWVMGITGAIMALTFGINGLFLGFLSQLNFNVPLIISLISLASAALLMIFYKIDTKLIEELHKR